MFLVCLLSACIAHPYSQGAPASLVTPLDKTEDQAYQLGQRRIHYVEASGGPARILFLHGSPGNWKGWKPYLSDPRLRAQAQMLAVDRPGWSESDFGQVVPSLQTQAELLRPMITEADQPTLLVAHSYGGAVAALMAMNYPSNVRGIVLVAPSISPDLVTDRWYDQLAKLPLIRALLSSRLALAYLELAPLQGELETVRSRWDLLKMPVTIIQGTDDWQVDPRTVDFARNHLSPSTLTIRLVANEGHRLLWNRTGLVVDAILNTLDRTQSTAPPEGAAPPTADSLVPSSGAAT